MSHGPIPPPPPTYTHTPPPWPSLEGSPRAGVCRAEGDVDEEVGPENLPGSRLFLQLNTQVLPCLFSGHIR